ncbi:MAG: serine/threonine-protein phosphatase, partial [Ruminococcus sp.]|nr:serine/threonine-protein phosphatase [Ruminococcus sp.]
MNYYIYGYTSKGSVRSENEDRILVDGKIKSEGSRYSKTGAPFIAAVCDGVGGERAGEIAAQTCLEELAAVHYRSTVDMRQVVMDIHRKVKKNGVIGQGTLNMQTTLCALAVDEAGEAMCVNVGDSRMYRYVNAAIRQISTDQSYRQFIYEHGSDGEVSNLDPKLENAIVSSVGSLSNEPEIELVQLVTRFGKEPDDMILIVSDGISDYVSEQQLEIGMGLDLPIGQKLEAIAQLAVDNGSVDNISIVGIKPYITKQELEAITTEQKGETVNIQKLIAETDELGDILTFDINEILSKPYPLPEEQTKKETEKTKAEQLSQPEPEPEPIPEPAAEAEQEAEAEPITETAAEPETKAETVTEPETVSIPQTTEEE